MTDLHPTRLFRHRRPGAAIVFALVALAAVAALGTGGCKPSGEANSRPASASASKPLYHCPMHPEVVSDKPGNCPICGMRLVPIPAASPTAPESGARKPAPAGKGPGGSTPGSPEAAAGASAGSMDSMPGMPGMPGVAEPSSPPPSGTIPSVLDLGVARTRLAGVEVAEAATGSIARTVRAVGTVAVDESRIRVVTTKIAGFVEKLYVNTTGQPVRAGAPLFEVYSPELLASQEEYLRARRSAADFARSSLPEVRRGGEEIVAAARRRLELFDVPADFLAQLDQTGQARRTVVFNAPFSGVVTAKSVLAGQRIEPGMDLLTVTDLSRVWVIAQLYEDEIAAARVGSTARVTLPYDPHAAVTGRVAFVYPTLDADTRTLKVRLEFANPRDALKPGMFVNVDLGTSRAAGVVVPDSAVIGTGTRQVVFVETAPGRFALREVTVALRADGRAAIASGLRAGERVAVSANFLLDSESRLRDAAVLTEGRNEER